MLLEPSLVRRVAADVVLGTGGYVSTPAVLGARLAGRPVFLLEPNAVAGAANRLASKWCTAAFVAYEETARLLECEAVVSGIPVRRSFHEVDSLPTRDPHLLVLGGSQGALQINNLIPSVARRFSSDAGLAGLRSGARGRASVSCARGQAMGGQGACGKGRRGRDLDGLESASTEPRARAPASLPCSTPVRPNLPSEVTS